MSDEMARKKMEEITAAGDPMEAGRRATACGAEIDAILKKYNCMMDAQMTLSQVQGMHVKFTIIPKMNVQIPGMPGGMPSGNSGKLN